MTSITFEHIAKTYDNGFQAVRGIDLTVRDREFMVLVGPSGCGKTTSLRMIAGLEEPTSGILRIGQRVVNGVEPKDRDIAMVFQSYALYPQMTVRQNLGYGLSLRRTPATEIARKVEAVAAVLNLGTQLDKLPRQLSGGQRQRVAVGRAIVREPQVFLFDEPLSNLDAKLRGEMRIELRALQARLATTAVYVTHDQVEAMTLGDRITVMNQGCIQQVGTPLEVYQRPANRFVASFIGMPPMNMLSGRIAGADNSLALEYQGHRIALRMPGAMHLAGMVGQRAVLGLRAEHLAIGTEGAGAAAQGKVTAVEVMGDHTLVHVDLAGQVVIARLPGCKGPGMGEVVPLRLDTAHGHVFPESGDDAAANLTLIQD